MAPRAIGDAVAGRGDAPRRRAAHALWWRWLPWTAPRLRLGPQVRPQTRLELALCALFRCRREWPVRELVARLALAPAGSDDNLALVGSQEVASNVPALGRGAAWEALDEWLERGMVLEVEPARRAARRHDAPAARDSREQCGVRSWPARSPG
jgi:hypothetical protein